MNKHTKFRSRASEYNDKQKALGMVSPQIWVAKEDEPYVRVWAAHSRTTRLLKLADSLKPNSGLLLMMAGSYLALPLKNDEYLAWRDFGLNTNDEKLLNIVEEARQTSYLMEQKRTEAEYARSQNNVEAALRSDAKAHAYALLLKALRLACEAVTESRKV